MSFGPYRYLSPFSKGIRPIHVGYAPSLLLISVVEKPFARRALKQRLPLFYSITHVVSLSLTTLCKLSGVTCRGNSGHVLFGSYFSVRISVRENVFLRFFSNLKKRDFVRFFELVFQKKCKNVLRFQSFKLS